MWGCGNPERMEGAEEAAGGGHGQEACASKLGELPVMREEASVEGPTRSDVRSPPARTSVVQQAQEHTDLPGEPDTLGNLSNASHSLECPHPGLARDADAIGVAEASPTKMCPLGKGWYRERPRIQSPEC